MNFYDIYTTISLNPECERSMRAICEYLKCKNELETVKKALWKSPSMVELRGAFPFDTETANIYCSLWKAASAENYSRAEKFGRWLLRTVCPPADDEGMAAFHRRAKPALQPDNFEPEPQKPVEVKSASASSGGGAVQPESEWKMESDEDDHVIEIPSTKHNGADAVTKRSTKKSD
jgi:hypothetical protein